MASTHIRDITDTLHQVYSNTGQQKSFDSWLSDFKKQTDQTRANNYYYAIDKEYTQFKHTYSYLEKICDQLNYKVKSSLGIIEEIQDRISFISQVTGIDNIDFLNRIFNVNSLNDLAMQLTKNATEAYVFGGDIFGQIPGYKSISEFIGVQVSNGRNKATLENFLLNNEQSLSFINKMAERGSLSLIPIRDSNGVLTDFSFGIRARSRGQVLDVLKNDMNISGTQLPINYQDKRAVELVNAVIQGKSVNIGQETYNFSQMKANFGQRTESLTRAVYESYSITGEAVSGSVLESYIQNVLTRKDINNNIVFNISPGTSAFAGADITTALTPNGETQYLQNKNVGASRRFTYGTVMGTQDVMGFYAGIGPFNQIANKNLEQNYKQVQKETVEEVSKIKSDLNSQLWNSILDVFSEQFGIDTSEIEINEEDDELISDEQVYDLLSETLGIQ